MSDRLTLSHEIKLYVSVRLLVVYVSRCVVNLKMTSVHFHNLFAMKLIFGKLDLFSDYGFCMCAFTELILSLTLNLAIYKQTTSLHLYNYDKSVHPSCRCCTVPKLL